MSARDLTVFKWIVWVLMRNMPLAEVDNPLTRELAGISSSDHVSSRSLSTYIKYLVPLVEALVEKILPLSFGVMLDGWTAKSTHYVAVFAAFMYDNKCHEVLLGFSPPLDAKSYTAGAHRDLIAFILKAYIRDLNNVAVLIGDTCPTNKATVDLLGVRLLGCACHKLNLAIKKFVAQQKGATEAINSLRTMVTKATNLKAAAALSELTELVPLINNDTRWSSTYRMIERFFRIKNELRLVDKVEVPRRAELQVLRDLMPKLEKFDSIMVDL
ncbi:hypothetical protein PI124_g14212 [Phytophthora idaei]|nr:hypothetical protein PI125_g20111 [Phytophthora idaei]KAG3240902.1 hypothetical protein PI124_g14212 [Phytophthora idaei]